MLSRAGACIAPDDRFTTGERLATGDAGPTDEEQRNAHKLLQTLNN